MIDQLPTIPIRNKNVGTFENCEISEKSLAKKIQGNIEKECDAKA